MASRTSMDPPMGRRQQRSPTSVASPPSANSQKRQQGGGGVDDQNDGANGSGPPNDAAKRVTPPKRRKSSKKDRQQHPDMIVEQKIIDELLLVLGVIGSNTAVEETENAAAAAADGSEGFVPVTDCINWLQDFQRVLRRDHETYRPISLLLGKWRVVAQKLLPLVVNCRYDKVLVVTLCKILVLLTKPMSASAKTAGRLVIDVKSGKVEESVIEEQIVLRNNAIAQSELLMEYKKLFVRHSSHHYALQHKTHQAKQGEGMNGTGLLSIFTSLLAEPLSKTGTARTASDHHIIELILQLINNLLSITPINTFGSTEKSQYASQLHRELLIVLQEEMVLDVLVCVGQEVERRENHNYNLLLMEILSRMLRGQDPSDVALSAIQTSTPTFSAPVTLSTSNKKSNKKTPTRIIRTTTVARTNHVGSNSLKAHLQSERQKLQLSASSRHSHFGGTLLVGKSGGKQSYVSASDYLAKKSGGAAAAKGAIAGISQPTRRKNKKAEVFVGSNKSSTLHSRPGASATVSREVAGPTSKRAKLALNSFCSKFFKDCYGPVMKSLKNEFRRDSSRLEDGDRTIFFRIVWFFHQWWRVSMSTQDSGNVKKKKMVGTKARKVADETVEKTDDESSTDNSSAQNLIFTMDVFMFNLVLNSTDEFFEHKKPGALSQTVALYAEMIHMLHVMYESSDSTERMMALGLMDRLFYASDPLDRVPKLLSRWTPGMYSREHLCDLVECAHTTWKLLDANAQRCLQSLSPEESHRKRPKDAVERMNMTASEFDKDHYFVRKFVSNQTVFMYTQLLSQYAVNAAHVNRHIVAYFIRLCKFSIKNAGADGSDDLGGDFDDALGKNELATKHSTMEPILYNIGLFSVLETVLNDTTIRDKQEFEALLMFSSSFMKRFARAAEVNPMLYIEALFKHPIPHRFCELTTNMYVNEELRMIAVRELLLEDQRRYEQQEDAEEDVEKKDQDDVDMDAAEKAAEHDDEEEELEFNDDADLSDEENIVSKKKRRRKNRKNRKSKKSKKTASNGLMSEEEDQSDDEEDENEPELKEKNNGIENADAEGGVPNKESEEENEDMAPMADTEDDDAVAPVDGSPQLNGKKRIRKSLEKDNDDNDSDEDDNFLGSSTVPAKSIRRVIFEDDDDD